MSTLSRPEYELRNRALRILNDRQPHTQAARDWAHKVLRQARVTEELRQEGFTLRELSLGAQEFWGVPS